MFENKIQGVNQNNSYKENSLSAQIEALSKSIPEVTTTVEQKERAIIVKKQIINLISQELSKAQNMGNYQLANSMKDKIAEIYNEINVISNEIDNMESIFDKK